MIYLSIPLIVLVTIVYFSKKQLSNGLLKTLYCLFSANLLYELFKKNITGSTDYHAYIVAFDNIKYSHFINIFDVPIFEPLFRIFSWFLLQVFPSSTFIVLVIMINILIAIGIFRFYKDKNLAIFSLVFYTYSPLFLGMSTNIIRQMMVISLILLMFNLKGLKKVWFFILPLIHTSSVLVILIFIFNKIIKVKYSLFIFLVSIVMFVTGFNEKLFGSLAIFKEYTSASVYRFYGGGGNRIDFLLFTLSIVIISLSLYSLKIISSKLMKYILLSGTVFCLLGFQAFSERVAIYNWFFLVILVPYILEFFKRRIKF